MSSGKNTAQSDKSSEEEQYPFTCPIGLLVRTISSQIGSLGEIISSHRSNRSFRKNTTESDRSSGEEQYPVTGPIGSLGRTISSQRLSWSSGRNNIQSKAKLEL
jgi:hypothetical protein